MEVLELEPLAVATFDVDDQRRTMTGLVIPWGSIGQHNNGRRWRFARGSLKYADLKFIKFNNDHDQSQRVGRAIAAQDTDDGLVMTFKIGPGERGDKLLAMAKDGIKTGLSVEVEIDPLDTERDPENPGVLLVSKAHLTGVGFVRDPAFSESRLISVTASADGKDGSMPDPVTEPVTQPDTTTAAIVPPAARVTFSAEQFEAIMGRVGQPATETRPVVDPTRTPVAQVTREPLPYRFDREGNTIATEPTDHVFSRDLRDMAHARDAYGRDTDAGRRAMALVQADFSTVITTSVDELNPTIQRPDLWVDKRDYGSFPLWGIVNKGALPNGVQPFAFPKYNSSGTLVADHTEGTEPTAGAYTTTSQTVTPTAMSGKASLTREVWDMGGNPAVSNLIRGQMKRDWAEGLETATGAFLNTLTAAADITITTASVDGDLQDAWDSALAGLQYVRGGQLLTAFALEQYLYYAFVNAVDDAGRKLYPIIGPQNANGTAAPRFRTMDLSGVLGIPAWGLGAGTGGAANNSWLFDPQTVHGWSSGPQFFEFPGTAAGGGYAPTAMVDIAVWGYKAFANSDINGVRQVIYDNAA